MFHSSKDDGKIIQILRCLRTWNIGGEEEKKTARILSHNVCTPIFFYIECPKINARFEFAAIFASSCWQAWKKNS